MHNLIDTSFFVGELNIPNTENDTVMEQLSYFINKYEPECLNLILGYELYKAFQSEPTSLRMIALKNGVEYTSMYTNKLVKWDGLIPRPRVSLIANYIYYHFMESAAIQTTSVSNVAVKTDAGVIASPADKMIYAWSYFSEQVKQLIIFLWNSVDIDGLRIYPEFTYDNYFYSRKVTRKINIFGL